MNKPIKFSILALTSLALLQACNLTDENTLKRYSVTVTNLTNNQPLAPVGTVLHKEGYHAYSVGGTASNQLESLAESGDNSTLLSTAEADVMVIDTISGSGVITPGSSETMTVQGMGAQPRLSLVSMLVNTNDGFVAIDSSDISELASGESRVMYTKAYDAGTEANTEAASDVPGQSGEGFNMARNDRDFVAIHAGIVGMDDGLATSVLDQSHRFDNPVAKVVVTRTQ
ncbi:spondin domain-containing protein [Pseudomonadota bacterium]